MPHPLIAPMLALMTLTFVVWLAMGRQRLGYLIRHRIHPQKVASRAQLDAVVPESVGRAANNFANLCELPVIFYAACLAFTVLGAAHAVDVALAWAFVGGRIVHSGIHCTVNIVRWRFFAYLLSGAFLWALVARLAWSAMVAG